MVKSWTVIGFMLEMFGVLKMFGGFLGSAAGYLRSMPVVGPCLNSDPARRFLALFSGGAGRGPILGKGPLVR